MKRNTLITIVAAALTFGAANTAMADAKGPNIIFILADDLGWGDLQCYGHPSTKTPNLDQFANEGTLFTQFYVNASVCSPSRVAFMTGRYPARYGIHGHLSDHNQNAKRGMPDWLDPETHLLTRLLKEQGYATAHFGKWHMGSGQDAPDPGAYGVDDHRTTSSSGPGWEEEPYFRAKSTGLFVNEAIRFIKENPDRPFYVNIWTLLPHATLDPTPEDLKPWKRFNPNGVDHISARAIYYASVASLDQQLGTLFEALDTLGLAENTLVVFTSDNGPEDIHISNAGHSGVGSAGPFRGRKRSIYEGGIRVPFIVRWPGKVPAGLVDNTSVLAAVDFMPTVCKLAGVALPAGFKADGEDVSDILLGQSRPRTNPIFWEWRYMVHGWTFHSPPSLAIREGQWKLLMNPDRSRVELYDIPAAPMEVDNLADQHPDVVERLSAKLLAWKNTLPESPRDPMAGKNEWKWPVQSKDKSKSVSQK